MATPRTADRPLRWLLAVVACLSLAAAACSDDGSETSAEDTSDSTEAPAEDATTDETAEGSGDETAETVLGAAMGPQLTGDTAGENIATIAAGTPAVQALTRLVLQAGLLTTLRDGGPFTVFAPVDDAFAALPAETVRTVTADKDTLTGVLTLHVVPGSLTTADLQGMVGDSLETVNGGRILVEDVDGDLVVGGARIVVPDIAASNGTIHAVDAVIAAPNG